MALLAALLALAAVGASAAPAYPKEHLPHGNTTVFAVAENQHGTIIFALGNDNGLWQRYRYGNMSDFSDWFRMASAPNGTFDACVHGARPAPGPAGGGARGNANAATPCACPPRPRERPPRVPSRRCAL